MGSISKPQGTLGDILNIHREKIMKKELAVPVKQPDYILLSPLSAELFGYRQGMESRMCTELQALGIGVMLVDTGKELLLYARARSKETLEQLCTAYDIGGVMVEAAAIYDQMIVSEAVL
jgi:hypothetical protein